MGVRTARGVCLAMLVSAAAVALTLSAAPGQGTAERGRSAGASESEPAADEPARRAQVLASFEGGAITVGDMEDAVANKLAATRAEVAVPGGRQAFLERMITYDLLALEAKRRGYADRIAVRQAGRRAAVDTMWEQELAVDPETISEQEVEAYYEKHKRDYRFEETRRALYLQLPTRGAAKATWTRARALDVEAFRRLMDRRIEQSERVQGGILGPVDADGRLSDAPEREPLDAKLVDALFSLQRAGELVPAPVRYEQGWAVVMLSAITPPSGRTLEQAEPSVRARIASARAEDQTQDLLGKLRQELGVQVYEERMHDISLQTASTLDIPSGFRVAPKDPRAPPRVEVDHDDM